MGSLLPKTKAGNAVPKSAQSRRVLFGDLVPGGKHAGVIEGGLRKGHLAVTSQGEQSRSSPETEAEKAGSVPALQNEGVGSGSSSDPQEEMEKGTGIEGAKEQVLRDPLGEGASQGGESEEGQTDPPVEDPLMGVLTPEDNQELEQIEGTLEYEIYVAERAAAGDIVEEESERGNEELSEPVSTVKQCFGGGCASSNTIEGKVLAENAGAASQGSDAVLEKTVDPGLQRGEGEGGQTESDSQSAEESLVKADSKFLVDVKPKTSELIEDRGGSLSSNDVRDPARRRALLQRKIDEQLAPYKKGGFTFADVAAQKEKTAMSTHFIIKPGNITLIKDPDELSDNWSYWFR